jgi:hypothetical protein
MLMAQGGDLMGDILAALTSTPVPIILAAAGVILTLLSAFGASRRGLWLGLIGLGLVVVALLWHFLPLLACTEEVIHIDSPQPGAQVTSPVTVGGFGGPAFESTLSVEVYDESGQVVGKDTLVLQGEEVGQRGPFRGQVAFKVERVQPGRISVFIVSPRDGGIQHLSSVEVTLAP